MTLQVKKITVDFNGKKALDKINFEAFEGILSIMGPSGSGKTTLLRCLAGLQEYSGDIFFDEKNINQVPTAKRNIGLVTQDNTLFPHLTVYENLAFPLKIRKIDKQQISIKINALLEKLQITNLKRELPQNISGGEQQRVAIARSLVYQPKILLLDEPFAQLDETLRQNLLSWLKQMIINEKILTLFVTHQAAEAKFFSQRLIFIDHGRLK